jgi:hypothetical protein
MLEKLKWLITNGWRLMSSVIIQACVCALGFILYSVGSADSIIYKIGVGILCFSCLMVFVAIGYGIRNGINRFRS